MITEMNARFLTRARKRRKNLGNFFVAGTKFILMANVGGYAGLRIRNSGVETTGGTVCEPSKLYRSHAPRPRKRGRGRKSSDPTAPRRTPLSMLSRPFCFPTSSCLGVASPSQTILTLDAVTIPRPNFLIRLRPMFAFINPSSFGHGFVLLSPNV